MYPFTLGLLAAVNPCGFPLLPAYLEVFVATDVRGGPTRSRAMRAVSVAALSTVGFLVLFGALGTVSELGWSAFSDLSVNVSRFIAVAVGLAMVVVGSVYLTGRVPRLGLPEVGTGAGLARPARAAVFGFSYGVASLGCALPLFVAGVASSFSRGGFGRGIEGLLAYGLGMASVLGGLALGIAVLGAGAGRLLRRVSRRIPLVGGALLIVSGVYVTWYWIADIVKPGREIPAQSFVTGAQQHLAGAISGHAVLVGGFLGALLVGAILAGGLSGPRSTPQSQTEVQTPSGFELPALARKSD